MEISLAKIEKMENNNGKIMYWLKIYQMSRRQATESK